MPKHVKKPKSKKKVIKTKRKVNKPINISKAVTKGPFKRYDDNDPFPPVFMCKMTYVDSNTLSTGVAGVFGTEQVFRLNSLFDPNFTGTGRQPYCYDQITPLYRYYQVFGVNIEIIANDPSADAIVIGAIIQPSNATVSLTGRGIDEVKEKPMCITFPLNNTGSQTAKREQYMALHVIEGINKVQYMAGQSDYSSAVGTSPTKNPYLRLALASDRSNAGDSCIVRVKLTFYTKFFDRITQGSS